MPGFVLGKNARLYVNQFDLTSYFNDFTFAAKAGTAETTVYGRGAKTYIGGIIEGTLSAKGFFDGTANAIDNVLSNAMGAGDQAITFSPTGSFVPGTRIGTAAGVATDYTVLAPVAGVVAVNATFLADGGFKTGVVLHDPAAAESTVGTVNGQTGLTDSNGGVIDQPGNNVATTAGGIAILHVPTFTGTATPLLTVAKVQSAPNVAITYTAAGSTTTVLNTSSTTGISATGIIAVNIPGVGSTFGWQQLAYDSITATSITLHTALSAAQLAALVNAQAVLAAGTWVDLVTINTANISAPTFATASIPVGTTINPWLRSVYTTTGGTVAFTFMTSLVRF